MASGSRIAQNTANVSRVFTLSKAASATLSGGGFNIVETLLSGTNSISVGARGTTNFGSYTGSGSSTATLLSGFTPFIGTGSTNLNFVSSSLFSINPNSGTLTTSPLIGGAYKLTYDYTDAVIAAVPESTTWAMMLMGFGMVGAGVRARRKAPAQLTFA